MEVDYGRVESVAIRRSGETDFSDLVECLRDPKTGAPRCTIEVDVSWDDSGEEEVRVMVGDPDIDRPRGDIHVGSIRHEDTAEHNNGEPITRKPRPGRNDPCSCGSGKKFKACCGR